MSKHKDKLDVIYFGPAKRYTAKRFVMLLPLLLIPHLWFPTGIFTYMALVAIGFSKDDLLTLAVTAILTVLINLLLLYGDSRLRGSAQYAMHADGVSIYYGSWNRKVEFTPFRAINKLELSHGPLDRLYGLGEVTLHTGPRQQVKLVGLPYADDVYAHIAGEMNRMDRALYAAETETWFGSSATLPGVLPSGRAGKKRPTTVAVRRG